MIPSPGKATSNDCLKEIIKNSRGFSDFIYTDRTIQQLKYAGGLRLIHDEAIVDSIIKYDAEVRTLLIHQGVLENLQQICVNDHNSMIAFIPLHNLYDRKINTDQMLLTNDKREINKYFNEIYRFKIGCLGQMVWLQRLKDRATRFLIFVRNK